MIPEVSESMKEVFEVEYPVAECTAAIGFFLVLMLEQLVTRNKLIIVNKLLELNIDIEVKVKNLEKLLYKSTRRISQYK